MITKTFAESPFLKSASQRETARSIIEKFPFVEELPAAAQSVGAPLVINLEPNARPQVRRNYPMTAGEEKFAEEQIRSWLRSGTIGPSHGSWLSPIVIACHPRTGKPRLCDTAR